MAKHRLCWKATRNENQNNRFAEDEPEADLLEGSAPWQRDFHDSTAAGCGASSFCSDFRGCSQHLRSSPDRSARPAGGCPRPYLSDRSGRGGDVLSGRRNRQARASGIQLVRIYSSFIPLISISAVSSLPGARRYSLITCRASSASSSRTRMMVPPTPEECPVARRER